MRVHGVRESRLPLDRFPKQATGEHTLAVSYDPAIYLGAAPHYRHGRPAYSPQLETVLTAELDLDGKGRLLDAGCGPGILTIRLAHLFEEAVGLDPDAAMLAEGRRVADERGITNIRWVHARPSTFPQAAPGPYRLVTFGQSFHWTDEARVAEAVYDMLGPGGALALIVHTVEGGPTPTPGRRRSPRRDQGAGGEAPWSTRRAGEGIASDSNSPLRRQPRAHPVRCATVGLRPGHPRLVRNSDSVLSGYFSMSYSAPHLFGDRVEDFASDMCDLLASRSPEGIFWDWPGDTEVILVRRPG